ncbi:MAG: cupin domain-containing protein [Sphingobacteriaceae bacterium]|jgi:mannose-6-phosphate isomerase-like protein (cupin superfamily)
MKHFAFIVLLFVTLSGFSQNPNVINTESIEPGNTSLTNKTLFNDSLASSFCIIIKSEVKAHKHLKHTEHVIVQEGEGVMKLNDKEFTIKEGDVIFIPKNTVHSVIVKGKKPLKVLSIQSPNFNGDDRVMME